MLFDHIYHIFLAVLIFNAVLSWPLNGHTPSEWCQCRCSPSVKHKTPVVTKAPSVWVTAASDHSMWFVDRQKSTSLWSQYKHGARLSLWLGPKRMSKDQAEPVVWLILLCCSDPHRRYGSVAVYTCVTTLCCSALHLGGNTCIWTKQNTLTHCSPHSRSILTTMLQRSPGYTV